MTKTYLVLRYEFAYELYKNIQNYCAYTYIPFRFTSLTKSKRHLELYCYKDLKRYAKATKKLETVLKLQPGRDNVAQIQTLIIDFKKKALSN